MNPIDEDTPPLLSTSQRELVGLDDCIELKILHATFYPPLDFCSMSSFLVRHLRSKSPPFSHPCVRRASSSPTDDRIQRLINRLPKSFRPYVSGLKSAPISHVASFLILHEITAVVPLVALGLGFHYSGWLPSTWTEGRWMTDGLKKFSAYFGRKGWFGFEHVIQEPKITGNVDEREELRGSDHSIETEIKDIKKNWVIKENGMKILVEVATAYAITKCLLPARIILSVWSTPWFAKVVFGRIRGNFTKVSSKPLAKSKSL
ncbi:hypothetical protein K3495_g2451 [Podosphaera aphanis]|nr:hypothetical protein K3495_g2451 [Podosphaera aphanis]